MDILLIAQFSFFPCSLKLLFRQLFDIILMSDEDLKALLLFFEYFASYRYYSLARKNPEGAIIRHRHYYLIAAKIPEGAIIRHFFEA